MKRKTATSPAPDERCPKCGRGGPWYRIVGPYSGGTVTASSTSLPASYYTYTYDYYGDAGGAKSPKPKKRKRRR